MADKPESTSGGGVDRRGLLKYAGAGAAGVSLAGCKVRQPTTPTPSQNGGGRGTVTGTPSNDAPLRGKTIRIGSLAPQPESFPIGSSIWNSMQLATDDINSSGGVAGADVVPKSGNTETSPATGRSEFLRLVQEEGVHTTFGTFLTQVTLQCFIPMRDTKTCHITTAAAGPKPARIVSQRYDEFKYHFRAGPINSFDLAKAEIEFLELYAAQLGWDEVAVLIEDIGPFDPFAELLDENIRDVVDTSIFKRSSSGTTNWTPLWDEVENTDAKVCLIAQALTGASAVKQWAQQERSFEFGGISVPAQVSEFWESVDGACEHVFTMNAVTPQTTNTPRTQELIQRYQDTFDTVPVYSGPITYDAVMGWRKAMEAVVEEKDLRRVPTSDELVEAMENLSYNEGTVLPEFSFTPKDAKYAHDPQWSNMQETGVPVWQQWQLDEEIRDDYGTMHSFAPEQNKSSDYTYPDWIDYPSGHPANQ